MKLLLDTHSFLWFIDGNPRLSHPARQMIEDLTNERWLSIASLWELAIKHSMGRLTFAQPFATLIPAQLQRNSMQDARHYSDPSRSRHNTAISSSRPF